MTATILNLSVIPTTIDDNHSEIHELQPPLSTGMPKGMNIHYWNFKERFHKIDAVTEELNPIINNNSIAKYIEKSFQVDAEEVVSKNN